MHILELNMERGWRGGERQTLYSMRQFRQAGHEVSLLARRAGPLAQRALCEGFAVHEFDRSAGVLRFLMGPGRRFDIVHAQTANTATCAALTRWAHRRPVVFSRRTSFKAQSKSWATRFKWGRIDLLVAISEAAAEEPRRLGFEPLIIRSAVEPVVADEQRVARFRDQFKPGARRLIGTSAALTPEKDPLTMIRAVHQLSRWRDDFIFFHWGGGGSLAGEAAELVADLDLQGRYIFTGFQDDVESLYSILDVFAMSSRNEALGSSVLDAFLQRIPVVSTNAGGLAESLSDGRGILCDVGDSLALARGMQRLLDDTALRASIVGQAYAYVRAEHDVQNMARRYLRAFEGLVRDR